MPELPTLYLLVKYLHVGCVSLSGLAFLVRGLLALNDSALLKLRWVRILPHINDSLLLAAATCLAVMSKQYPFVDDWLTAKILGLCLYIALASFALRPDPRRSRLARTTAFCAALSIFVWIVSVAINRSPAGILGAV